MQKIMKKYNNLPVPAKATMWFALCSFITKGIGVITTPFFTRLLPTSEYGLVSTFYAWNDLFVILITLSCWRGMMNLYVKGHDKKQVLSCTIALSYTITFVFSFFIFLGKCFLMKKSGLSELLLWGIVFEAFSINIWSCWLIDKQYSYEFKPVVIVSFLNSLISTVAGVLFVIFYKQTAVARLIPVVVCAVILTVYISLSSIAKGKCIYSKDIWKGCLTFSIPLLPHYFSEMILQSSDRIMINSMCSSTDVAIYGVAYSVGSLILLVTSAINSSFAPFQYQKIQKREYGELRSVTNMVLFLVAICLCVIMIFGKEIVFIFGGEKYQNSVEAIIPICAGIFFNYVFQLFARVQEYYEQKWSIVVASVACAVLNIVLNYIFIQIYGYIAAAYTTFACYFVFCFLHYIFYRMACKKYVKESIYDTKGIIFISVAVIVFGVIIQIVQKWLIFKYALLLVLIVIVIFQKNKIFEVLSKFVKKGVV